MFYRLCKLLGGAWLGIRTTQAFVPVGKTAVRHSPYISGNVHQEPQVIGRRGAVSGLDMAKKPSPMPILSEEELVAMEENRLLANRKVEGYLERAHAEREAHRMKEKEDRRNKVVKRIEAQKEDAAHKKEYIPQRLEEIEREQESLKGRVSDFNDKIKDTEIKQI